MGNSRVLEGKGRFINLRRKTANKIYDNFFVYVPVEVARDSGFPFKPKEPLIIKVDREKKRVVLEKARKI
jgi:bifunctional DNA-binding transcriptional regulator/antitoxin component of YhaV-PrlF toxin-antitoxin module